MHTQLVTQTCCFEVCFHELRIYLSVQSVYLLAGKPVKGRDNTEPQKMAAVAEQCEPKLSKLLDSLLSPQPQNSNDYYLNSLLSHFSGKENKDVGEALLRLPTTIRWIEQALVHSENVAKPSVPISMFLLNLTALVSRDEEVFARYNKSNVYKRLFKTFNITTGAIPPTIKLAYVKILSAFIEHKAGLEWVLSNEIWKDCLNFCLANETIYIIREGHVFIFNLLARSAEVRLEFTECLVGEILGKFNENLFSDSQSAFPEVEDEALQRKFRPTINLIKYVLEEYWKSDLYKAGNYKVVECFIKNNNLEVCMNKILILTRNSELVFDLYSVLTDVACYELVINAKSDILEDGNLIAVGRKLFNFISTLINNSEILNVVKLSHFIDIRWAFLKKRMPPGITIGNKEPLLLENQLLVFQILPVFGVSFVNLNIKFEDIDNDDLRDAHVHSLLQVLCESTIRMGYRYREIVTEQGDAFDAGKRAIMYAMRNVRNYDKFRGVKIFQVCCYSLQDLCKVIAEKPYKVEMIKNNTGYCIVLLDLMEKFIREFGITWRDSVETTCITATTIEFLSHNFWPPMVIVQGLKLVKLSIEKFLPPTLALLVDTENDNTNDGLGNLILTKLHDMNWEVRDSALEVVYTIANISDTKYPSFRKLLMKLDVLTLVVTMCVNDSEGFVRASAIKCLQEMIKVQQFWKEVLIGQDLAEKMMKILREESEAIVRTEAASLMRYIHEHQSFPNHLLPEIYAAMSHAAISDLHWEVKSNALDFWGKVTLNHLHDQGFLDGKFPTVTFSKENRKIVTLTDTEIKARLNKVLCKLSENRCLSVFVSAVRDDCDLEVAKKSLEKLKKIKHLLLRHDMIDATPLTPTAHTPPDTLTTPTPHVVSNNEISDRIIEEILNTNDAGLLKEVYSPDFENLQSGRDSTAHLEIVTPETFLNFIRQDLDSLVEQKHEWFCKMDGLNSLLDDMLKSYDDDINAMDCY